MSLLSWETACLSHSSQLALHLFIRRIAEQNKVVKQHVAQGLVRHIVIEFSFNHITESLLRSLRYLCIPKIELKYHPRSVEDKGDNVWLLFKD
jgi:hypothetical protein